MGLFDNIKKRNEKKKINNYFWSSVTADCKARYNKANTDFDMTIIEFNKQGWYITNNEDMLYKKGTSACLNRTDNGFDINPLETNIPNLEIEKKFIKVFGPQLQDLNKTIEIKNDFRHGYGWEFQANVNVDEFMLLAKKLGYIKDLPLEYSNDDEEKEAEDLKNILFEEENHKTK